MKKTEPVFDAERVLERIKKESELPVTVSVGVVVAFVAIVVMMYTWDSYTEWFKIASAAYVAATILIAYALLHRK